MTTLINPSLKIGKKSVAKGFGVLFIALCLIASALTIGIPHGSSASGLPIIVTPSADTFVNSRLPDQSYGRTAHLDVRGTPGMTSFLRFQVSGIGQNSVAQARLRLYAIKSSLGKPVSLKVSLTPADWDAQAISWAHQPALGQPIIESAPALIESGQWVELDLGQTVTGDGVYNFALTSDSQSTLSFWSSIRTEAPQLALLLQPNVQQATQESSVDPATAAADASEPTSDVDLSAPGAAAPRVLAAAAAPQAQAASTPPNPMGCLANETFTDMQDWWMNPDPTKQHGHLHVSVCFPHNQTVTGKVTFRVRSVLHANPGSLIRLAIYTTSPTVAGTKTCGGNGGLACVQGLPRTQARCAVTGGTLSPDGLTCTWWDSMVVNTADVAYDGWQEFRFKGYVNEPDGTQMVVSNGLHVYFKNGHPVKDAVKSPDTMTARGWYTDVDYADANLIAPPKGPVSGIWKPSVKFAAPSGLKITGYYAALDTDFHNSDPGIPIKSGTAAWSGNLVIDTTKLSNGWHRLFLKADAFQKSSGSTNSGVLAILFDVENPVGASTSAFTPVAFETPSQPVAGLLCTLDGHSFT